MPLPATSTLPEEKVFPLIPADVYNVTLEDLEEQVSPSQFKNPDGSDQSDQVQYKLTLKIVDEGEYKDRTLFSWVRPSLRSNTKSKYPTLPQLLLAVTGKAFGPDDKDKVTGEFLNSFIGSKLRVTTGVQIGKTNGKEYSVVVAYLSSKT